MDPALQTNLNTLATSLKAAVTTTSLPAASASYYGGAILTALTTLQAVQEVLADPTAWTSAGVPAQLLAALRGQSTTALAVSALDAILQSY